MFRIIRASVAVLLFLIVAINCKLGDEQSASQSTSSNQVVPAKVENIDVSTFKELAAGENETVVILDVRTPGEYAAGYIPNSKLIDINSRDFKTKIAELDKDKTYLVYCRSGSRSSRASEIMTRELGFTDVKNLMGGYMEYARSN